MFERRFFVFMGVGIACAVIDIGLMQFLMLFGVHYVIAATAGFAAGLVLNFLLHTCVTFNAEYSHRALVRFMIVVLTNYLLTVITISVFHSLLGTAVQGKVASLPLVAINGYLLSKYWVYR